MAFFQLIVTPDELVSIIKNFAAHRKLLGCARTRDDGYFYYEPDQMDSSLIYNRDVISIYLLPRELAPQSLDGHISPRQSGWFDIDAGRVTEENGQRILEVTTIQAEDRKELPFRGAYWLRALKKQLFGTMLMRPTRITNVVYGGTGLEDDVGYSKAAEKLFNEGIKWKQRGVKNQEWSPAAHEVKNNGAQAHA